MREQVKALKDRRAKVWGEISKINEDSKNEGRDMSAEELVTFTRGQADVNAMTDQIAALEEQIRLDATMSRTVEDHPVTDRDGKPVSHDEYNDVFKRYLAGGISALEQREKQILRGQLAPLAPGEARAIGVLQGQTGGYTVPEGFWARISEVQKWFGGVEQLGVNTITTTDGADLPWPTNDDTSNVGALLGENTQVSDLDVSFGARVLSAHTYTTKQIRVSLQLLQDSAFDVEAFVAKKFGQRLGRIHNTHFTTGDGIAKPQGFITGATSGKTTASATAIVYGEVIDLIHSVDPAYRNAPGVKLTFHDLVLAYLQKLTDSQNRPLWLPSIREGAPDTFLGYPYVVNNDMASTVAANNLTMAFGDFNSGYVVRKVKGISILRLDERYADYLQVGFLGFDRVDGMTDDANAYKVLTQHS